MTGWNRFLPGSSRSWFPAVLGTALLLATGPTIAEPVPATDPLLPFSSLLGGSVFEDACTVGRGPDGVVWVAVRTFSRDYPGAARPKKTANTAEVLVQRIDPGGGGVLSTVLLGGDWIPTAFAFDAEGSAFLAGTTDACCYWTPVGAPGPAPGDPPLTGVFLVRMRGGDGSVAWTRVIGGGGEEEVGGLLVTPDGDPVVVGRTTSPDFPLAAPLQPDLRGDSDAFVTRVHADGSGYAFSTFLGGMGGDGAASVTLSPDGHLLVAGTTATPQFPAGNQPPGAEWEESGGFVAEIDVDGTEIHGAHLYRGLSLAGCLVEGGGDLLLRGFARREAILPEEVLEGADPFTFGTFLLRVSSPDQVILQSAFLPDFFASVAALGGEGPVWMAGTGGLAEPLPGAARPYSGSGRDVSVMALSPSDLDVTYATFLAGRGEEEALGIFPDENGSVWIAGTTSSVDFPLSAPIQVGPPDGGPLDGMVFVSHLRPADPEAMPEAPAGLVAAVQDDGTVRLEWEDRSSDETGFAIYRHGTDGLDWNWPAYFGRTVVRRVAVVPGDTGEWIDEEVASNRRYSWTVQAINDRAASAPSIAAELQIAPTLEATVDRGDLKLRFKRGRFRLRLRGRFAAEDGSPGGAVDPREGFEWAVNNGTAYMARHGIPPGDPGWRSAGRRLRWSGDGMRLTWDPRTGVYDLVFASGGDEWFDVGDPRVQFTVGRRSTLVLAHWRGTRDLSGSGGRVNRHYRIP